MIWWSKHVGVILNVLVCDIWINVLLQKSALVGPWYTVPSVQLDTTKNSLPAAEDNFLVSGGVVVPRAYENGNKT
jgi:hypothetical protein